MPFIIYNFCVGVKFGIYAIARRRFVMKRVMGYALAFTIGTMVSGSVAFAASNYVQALEGQSNVTLNGQSVANPPKLVFSGTTYVQLYSIEQALKQAGITPSWDGNTFDMEGTGSYTMPHSDFKNYILGMQTNFVSYVNSLRDTLQSNPNNYLLDESSTLQTINKLQGIKDVISALDCDSQESKVRGDFLDVLETQVLIDKTMADGYGAMLSNGTTTSTQKLTESIDIWNYQTSNITQFNSDLSSFS
jgi:hypothetical protein